MFRILDVGRDLRPVHPAALRLTRIVHHAGGQFQIGFRQRVGGIGRRKIRHRIVGRVQTVGGGILQPRDDALAVRGQRAALRPQRSEVARGVEFLDRGPLGLAVEIARRFGAQQILEFVGDRLIRGRDVARGLDRLLGGFGGRRSGSGGRRRSRGGGRRVLLGGIRLVGVGGRSGDDVGRLCLGRLLRGLRCIHSGRVGGRCCAVQLEIVDGRGRDVGGFRTRDRRIDRKFGGAVAGRVGLGQSRRRGHREEGRGHGHQHAVKSGTVLQTVSHRHTPWAKLPRHGTVLGFVRTAFAKAPALLETPFSQRLQSTFGSCLNALQISRLARLHATIHTQTIHAPLSCSQHHAGQLTTN